MQQHSEESFPSAGHTPDDYRLILKMLRTTDMRTFSADDFYQYKSSRGALDGSSRARDHTLSVCINDSKVPIPQTGLTQVLEQMWLQSKKQI